MANYLTTSPNVVLFTDIHFGNDKNSEQFLGTCSKTVDWIIETCRQKNTSTVIFGGDWFDHRDIISVKTFNEGYAALRKMSNSNLKVFLVVGNHDIYYKEKLDIHSLAAFGEIPGVTIVDETSLLTVGNGAFGPGKNRRFLLVPWTCDPFALSHARQMFPLYDAVIGHMEVRGVQMRPGGGPGSVSEKGVEMSSFFDLSDKVYIGHYHIRNTYKFKKGVVKAVGCPFEMDRGDSGLEKGITCIDIETMEEEFITNDFAPKHVDVYYSKAKELKKSMIEGNYPRLIVDVEHDWDKLNKLMAIINSLHPAKPVIPKYLHAVSFQGKLEEASRQITESCSEKDTIPSGSVYEASMAYIDISLRKMGSALEAAKLKKMASSYLSTTPAEKEME